MTRAQPITYLYAPADRPDVVVKALRSEADVVVVDLEDAVAASKKELARAGLEELLRDTTRPVQVRVNAVGTPWHEDDLAAISDLPPQVGVRIPDVRSVRDISSVHQTLPIRGLHPFVESAIGIERAFDIASANPQVFSLGLGEADLKSDLGVDGDEGLVYARSRIVIAARAAGLPAPAMSVYPRLGDDEGLEDSCRTGRALGFRGRAAIHPSQLDVIRRAFAPSPEEVARAREVIERVEAAEHAGSGVVVLEDGSFLDAAMVLGARDVIVRAEPEVSTR